MRRGAWIVVGGITALVLIVVVGVLVRRPPGPPPEQFDPVKVGVQRDDHRMLWVYVVWPYDGMCGDGDLHPVVDENDHIVVIQRVERRTEHGACGGWGTEPGSLQSGVVELDDPLGDRTVIRASDGERLPVSWFDF